MEYRKFLRSISNQFIKEKCSSGHCKPQFMSSPKSYGKRYVRICFGTYTERIPGLRPANERRRYKVTPSLIGWAQI